MSTRDPSPKRKTSGRLIPEVKVCDPSEPIVPVWAARGQAAGEGRRSQEPADPAPSPWAGVFGNSSAKPQTEAHPVKLGARLTRALPPGIEPLLGIDELAASLGCSRRLVERMRSAGKVPKPDIKIGKMPRWRVETIRRWIAEGGRP